MRHAGSIIGAGFKSQICNLKSAILPAVFGLFTPAFAESPWIFGIHDPEGAWVMGEAGKPGWILFTEALGADPNDDRGGDYRWAESQGYGVIVRLNHGYGDAGTLPYSWQYDAFARRCANFVAHAPGSHLWIVGNETNLPAEWPGGERGEPITVDRYVTCYRKVRAAIRAVPGHANDSIVPSPPSPGGAGWKDYQAGIFRALEGQMEGVALHFYTFGQDPANLRNAFASWIRNDAFYGLPAAMRGLPAYITETNAGGWIDADTGWVKTLYAGIDSWNRSGGQVIRAACLYRWAPFDAQYSIANRPGVIQDWREAMQNDYRWDALQPDVVVDQVWTSPATPAPGQPVTFYAKVRNAGAKATPSDVWIGVGYLVGGRGATWGIVPGPLAPGASVTIGTNGAPWVAGPAGTYVLTAIADDVNRFPESNEGNNARSVPVTIGTLPTFPAAVKVTTSTLNVRSGPGTSYALLGTVSLDQRYVALAAGGGWLRIQYDDRTGWIHGGYASRITGVTSVIVNTDVLNVRTGPGTTYAVAGTVSRGRQFIRSAAAGSWQKIFWRGGAYWVLGTYVTTKSY